MTLLPLAAGAQSIRWHNEAQDTTIITRLLADHGTIANPNARVEAFGRCFLETPYAAGTLEHDSEEALTVNLDELDCTTFVENVMALAITGGERRSSWRDFLYNLRNIRYRGGEVNGYASRLHYISDWVVDNVHRGNFNEVTNRFSDAQYEVKTLDFMSANRQLYPALSDSAAYAEIKSAEIGYRNHRYPIIKTKSIGKAAKTFLKPGDIVALTTSKKGLDVSHMGIIVFEGGEPHLMHASSKSGKVIVDKLPLGEYMQKNRSLTGIRIFRLKE